MTVRSKILSESQTPEAPAAKLPHRENTPPAQKLTPEARDAAIAAILETLDRELPNTTAQVRLSWMRNHYPAWFQTKNFWSWPVANAARDAVMTRLAEELVRDNAAEPVVAPTPITQPTDQPGAATALAIDGYLRKILASTGYRRLNVILDSAQGYSVDLFEPGYPLTIGFPSLQAAVDAELQRKQPQPAVPPATALPAWQDGWDDEDEGEWLIAGARPFWTIDDFSRPRVILRKLAEQTKPELIACLTKRYRQLDQSTDQPIPTL